MNEPARKSIKLIVEYDGGDYRGWASQKVPENIPTIQAALEDALSTMLSTPMQIRYASRTDAGVHARGQVIAFDPPESQDIPLVGYIRGLTTLTSESIVIREGEWVDFGWCPRRNSRGKIYKYTFWNSPQPSAIERDFSWWERSFLDVGAMHEAGQVLIGTHDFSSFRATGCNAAHAVRQLFRLSVSSGDYSRVHLEVMGNAFVKNMVRVIAGTLRDVGLGKISIDELRAVLAAKDRTKAGMTAPPQGLCLEEVIYDDRLPPRQK